MADRRFRLLRGGSWDVHTGDCRSVYRYSAHPGNHGVCVGFRVCGPDPAEHVIPLEDHHG